MSTTGPESFLKNDAETTSFLFDFLNRAKTMEVRRGMRQPLI